MCLMVAEASMRCVSARHGQGVLPEQRALGFRGRCPLAGLSRPVRVEQQGVAGSQAEPDVRKLDIGKNPSRGPSASIWCTRPSALRNSG